VIPKHLRGGAQIRQAKVLPFNLTAIIGLSTSGADRVQPKAWRDKTRLRWAVSPRASPPAKRDPRISRVFTTFTGTHHRLFDIDRASGTGVGVNMSDVFTDWQADASAGV